jgi:hypothetical protein
VSLLHRLITTLQNNASKPLHRTWPTSMRSLAYFCIAAAASAAWAEDSGGGHGEVFEPHSTLGVFLGDTTENRRDGLTLGLEYEYRLNEVVGIGLTAEHVGGAFDTNVIAIPIAAHRGRWKLYAGPGIEFSDDGDEPLFRIGAEYGFHYGSLEISPQLDLDFVNGERLFVFGLVIAREL